MVEKNGTEDDGGEYGNDIDEDGGQEPVGEDPTELDERESGRDSEHGESVVTFITSPIAGLTDNAAAAAAEKG